jgi:EAL domain-containing protein (putative c-di-GMP-specific phosphodiesterase class I)
MSGLKDLALDPRQLQTRYQPIFRCAGETSPLAFAECLLRGPKGTNLESPLVLFEYARRKCFEIELDLLAFRCFLVELSAVSGLQFSVNFHASTLSRDGSCAQRILSELERAGVLAALLHIEIIEAVDLTNLEALLANLAELRVHGVKIALDDFGVAHSNLQLLGVVRPELIKIDRTILPGPANPSATPACFAAAVECARSVGAEIVAEGVETIDQLAFVRTFGIEYAQGFYFEKPITISQLEERLWPGLQAAEKTRAPLAEV